MYSACSGSPQVIDQVYIFCHSWDHYDLFYLQSTLSISKPLSSDVLDHPGQPAAGGTSKLENTENNETFKQPQDEKDTGHKPPVDTATTANTQPYSDAKLLDINIKKNGAASSAVPAEQGVCMFA